MRVDPYLTNRARVALGPSARVWEDAQGGWWLDRNEPAGRFSLRLSNPNPGEPYRGERAAFHCARATLNARIKAARALRGSP